MSVYQPSVEETAMHAPEAFGVNPLDRCPDTQTTFRWKKASIKISMQLSPLTPL